MNRLLSLVMVVVATVACSGNEGHIALTAEQRDALMNMTSAQDRNMVSISAKIRRASERLGVNLTEVSTLVDRELIDSNDDR